MICSLGRWHCATRVTAHFVFSEARQNRAVVKRVSVWERSRWPDRVSGLCYAKKVPLKILNAVARRERDKSSCFPSVLNASIQAFVSDHLVNS